MNKTELRNKILKLDGLTNDEKSALVELLNKQKKYGLVWEDKPEDVEERLRDELPVLREVKDRFIPSANLDAPNHVLIEGDNLEALTALSYSHAGRVDVIYIDPPYNTRKKDFKYNDNFLDPNDDFSHSTWLSFMDKRLRLAKTLLSREGVIYIQIDDREYAPLKLLCDGIFLESNSIGPFIQNKLNAKNDTINIQKNHEYILCYRNAAVYQDDNGDNKKLKPNIVIQMEKKRSVQKEGERFYYLNDCITTRGEGGTLNARPNLGYTFYYNPKTNHVVPQVDYDVELARNSNTEEDIYKNNEDLISKGYVAIRPPKVRGKLGCWTWDFGKANRDLDLLFIKATRNRYNVHKRTFVPSENVFEENGEYFYNETVLSNSKSILEYSTNDGTDSFTQIMGYETDFNNPKNVALLKYLLSIIPNKKAIILDFFAGSGTTLQAIMELNDEDNGKRKGILVTNNENKICEEVTYVRNKKVINGYKSSDGTVVEGLHNNVLRYFKTEYVSRDQSPKNMRALVAASTDLLCIKNDIYTEAPFAGKNLSSKIARYFENEAGRMLVIYNEQAISAIAELFESIELDERGKIKVYTFAQSRYAFDDEFEDVAEKVDLCALPAAIYDAYRQVLPKRKPKFLPEALIENEEEISITETSTQNGMLNFTD